MSHFMPYNGIIKPSLTAFKITLEGAAVLADTVLIIDADVNSRTVLARSLRSAAIAYLDCKRGHLEALMNLMVALGGGLNEASLEEVLSSLEDSAQP